MKKLNIVLRTCDRKSIQSNRIVDKKECVIRCFNALAKSVKCLTSPYSVYVIDDGSSEETVQALRDIMPEAIIVVAEKTNDINLNAKQKSRKTVKMAYNYMLELPDDELVYIVEDDYLHYEDSLQKMLEAYEYFKNIDMLSKRSIGIFPQDFKQLYYDPRNLFNKTYVRTCDVIAGPDRYYRSTWFTHESFMIETDLLKKYQEMFYLLTDIGTIDGYWEGNTISNVWMKPDVAMLMPMKTLAIHLGCEDDISYFTDWKVLWEQSEYVPKNF